MPFALLYAWDSREDSARLEAAAGLAASELHAAELIDPRNKGDSWPIGSGSEMLIAERAHGVTLHEGPWPEATKRAAVLKIAAPGAEPYGYLVAGISPRRAFDDEYRDFLRLVGANIASAVAGVHALEDERKRAEALAELDRAKTAFFTNVSHEFRTPLTLILGPLEELLTKGEGALAQEERALLSVAQRNGQRLLRLVNALLDFARIEAGRTQASYQPTDMASLTAELASNFRSACERAGIRLTVKCAPLPEAIYLDHEMWEKIVLNLLSNAFKFTFEGEICVRVRDAGERVELEVSDTGTGVPEDELPRMFERFHRVENARGRSHEGSGIGLALVHELVKLHGGSINVRSVWGGGTALTVAVPKGSAHLPAERVKVRGEARSSAGARADAYVAEALGWLPAAATAPEPSPAGAQRILIADDNADLREYARRLLGDHYDVHTVPDGQAALEAARALRPDIIISDVMMPRLDGFGLIREIRADPQLQAIPIILLSARAGEEARVEGLGRGADDYLVKPFSARELLVRVGALVRSAEMHRRVNEARAQFETLLNAAPLGVYLVDGDFRIAAVNPVALPMFGDIPDLVGRDFDSVMHVLWPKDYADEIVQLFRRTLETGEPHLVPESIRERRDRRLTEYYEWQINRIPLPGDRRGVVCYFRDISKSVLVREALREADSRKDEFLATLSHELRNPLAPLRSSLEVLKRVGAQGQRAGQALDVMQRQLSHLVRLVDDLLEVSRITRGAVELRKERVRLDLVLRNALEASEPLMRARNHRVKVSIPQEPIVLMADPMRLAQVFGNLLNNAAKYSDENGQITIEAGREADEAVIAISDAGDGIEPDQLPKLFQIFMRGERSSRRNQSGLGIGLALVHRLTEMHGGRVEARSEGAERAVASRFACR